MRARYQPVTSCADRRLSLSAWPITAIEPQVKDINHRKRKPARVRDSLLRRHPRLVLLKLSSAASPRPAMPFWPASSSTGALVQR